MGRPHLCTMTWSAFGTCPFTTEFKKLASDLLRSTKEGCKAPSCQGNYGVKPTPSHILEVLSHVHAEWASWGPQNTTGTQIPGALVSWFLVQRILTTTRPASVAWDIRAN